MSDHSRRTFLALAGAGTAGVAAAAAMPGTAQADATMPADAKGAMGVFVEDIRTGRLTLMIEGAEVEVVDKRLAAQIARAYQRAR